MRDVELWGNGRWFEAKSQQLAELEARECGGDMAGRRIRQDFGQAGFLAWGAACRMQARRWCRTLAQPWLPLPDRGRTTPTELRARGAMGLGC